MCARNWAFQRQTKYGKLNPRLLRGRSKPQREIQEQKVKVVDHEVTERAFQRSLWPSSWQGGLRIRHSLSQRSLCKPLVSWKSRCQRFHCWFPLSIAFRVPQWIGKENRLPLGQETKRHDDERQGSPGCTHLEHLAIDCQPHFLQVGEVEKNLLQV